MSVPVAVKVAVVDGGHRAVADGEQAQPFNASATALDARGVVERERHRENALVAGWRHPVGADARRQDRRGFAHFTVGDVRVVGRLLAVAEHGDLEAGTVFDGAYDDDRVTLVVAVAVHADDGFDFHGAHANLPRAVPALSPSTGNWLLRLPST
jgi:hypothetical protein